MNKLHKPRIEEIEILRGFAFLAVVLQHSIAHYFPLPNTRLEDGVILGLLLLLAKFAVPLFVFITGMVLFYNYDGDIRYGVFLRKRFKDIVLPYLPWVLLYAIAFQHLNLFAPDSLYRLGRMAVTGKASYHLWYIVMIVQFYLLFPLLQRAVKKWKPQSASKAALLILALGLLYLLLMDKAGILYRGSIQLHQPFWTAFFNSYLDRNAIMYFFYFALGAAAGLYLDYWRSWLIRYRYILAAAYAALVIVMLFIVVAHFKLYPTMSIRYDDLSLLRPIMAVFLTFSIFAMYLFAMSFNQTAPAPLRKLIIIAGSYSYTAYLAHAYVLRYSSQAADLILPEGSITLRTLIAFIFCATGAILTAYLIRRIAKQFAKRKVT
ncbi:membrane protein [Paenibacillus baekrokdamisoli]|uniref:Membrane protein n=1 Tax=Paenibacillus baekrokdamisoli TaxID=1712516 RepID=A0A3G9IQP1_9BACL|nr:acyltransferase [Paenibacillus baekrokdamisoli]MBB3069952.1 peptidoglycan/LPS O-acetylase OafA/YrhL [Paenibacillus baekrokdamisoli]BBH20696.1 membrane protein [Paenibacillus baekrokdamisoli]